MAAKVNRYHYKGEWEYVPAKKSIHGDHEVRVKYHRNATMFVALFRCAADAKEAVLNHNTKGRKRDDR